MSFILIVLLILFVRKDGAIDPLGNAQGDDGIWENENGSAYRGDANPQDASDIGYKPEIIISMESGFYEEDIQIAASTEREGDIYYTSDGSLPGSAQEGSTRKYEGPIVLTAGEEETVTVYRFRAAFADGTESAVVTNTYFLGKHIEERYDTAVISLAAEADDLYGYENGIFVEGRLREEWLEEHPGEDVPYDAPANYNLRGRDSERDVHIEIFETDGVRVIDQDGGMRISGNFTRQSEQKSFKLYARKSYDPVQNRFRFPLFSDMRGMDGNVVDKYKSLKIRNTGNDRSEGFIRDELAMTLAAQAGYADTQSVRPVSVYINGVYQGLYWMHSDYDEEYFEEKYGKCDGEMVVIGSSEMHMDTASTDEASNRCAEEYNGLYERYSAADLTEDAVYEELNRYIDVENYLQYYALEIYMANRDWPYNNIQAYRYVAAGEDGYTEGTVFDGRYRYLLYDVDTAMGLGSIRESLNPDQSFETLTLLEERGYAPLFSALMRREGCREYFVSYVCDLLNGACSPENVALTLEDMHRLRENEMSEYIEESIRNPELPEIGEPYLEMQMDCIRAWAESAPDSMLEGMRQKWQLGEIYMLSAYQGEGEGIQINGITVTEPEFTGRYLTGCETCLTPVLPAGKEFSYWEVNGERYEEEKLLVDENMLIDGSLYVSFYTEENGGGLELSEIKAKGKDDYIILTNTSNETVSTRGYYLMDKEKVSHMNYLEDTALEPGESIRIGCKNYDGSEALMKVNFNLKQGKELMLAYAGTGVVEKVTIPDLAMEWGVYRKNRITGNWQEEREGNDGA